jgi:hypothetical protein
MTTPIANRSQTTVMGVAYPNATLVATKDAPQTVTENRALRMALRWVFFICPRVYHFILNFDWEEN